MRALKELLGKKRSEALMNSKLVKLSRIPKGAIAAKKVGATVKKINPSLDSIFAGAASTPSRKKLPIVWQIWLQGWENAPSIVHEVALLNKKTDPELEFKYLSFSDAADLVGLKRELRELHATGKISNAGIADLLRLRLIEQQGGVWLDATVALSPQFHDMLAQTPHFLLLNPREWVNLLPRYFTVTTWAFGAPAGDPFLRLWADVLEEHWLTHGQTHYFDAFYVTTALIRRGIFPVSDLDRSTSADLLEKGTSLMNYWLKDNDPSKTMEVYFQTPLHKLTYKLREDETKDFVDFLKGISSQLP